MQLDKNPETQTSPKRDAQISDNSPVNAFVLIHFSFRPLCCQFFTPFNKPFVIGTNHTAEAMERNELAQMYFDEAKQNQREGNEFAE